MSDIRFPCRVALHVSTVRLKLGTFAQFSGLFCTFSNCVLAGKCQCCELFITDRFLTTRQSVRRDDIWTLSTSDTQAVLQTKEPLVDR